jgi:hypothetical protein
VGKIINKFLNALQVNHLNSIDARVWQRQPLHVCSENPSVSLDRPGVYNGYSIYQDRFKPWYAIGGLSDGGLLVDHLFQMSDNV